MFPKDIYIDLGTENTLIYAKKQGILHNQPTVIAHSIKNGTHTTGSSAKKMIGKTPGHYTIYKPLEEGVVKDFEHAKEMLSSFLISANNQMLLCNSRILISCPLLIQEYESEMFRSLARELDASKVHLVSEPLAGAIGTGVDIFSKKPVMFLDMGAGTTEAIITFNGKIIQSEAVRVGGNDIDTALKNLLADHYKFSVGEQTAERIKKEVALLDFNNLEEKTCTASGISRITGLPETRTIDSKMVHSALLPTFNKISSLLVKTFNNCSPDITADIIDNGVYLFGGNSLIPGTAQFFSKDFAVPFFRANNPLVAVTIGGAKILDDDNLFKSLNL